MQSKATYIDSLLTKKDNWNKQMSDSSRKNLQIEAARMSQQLDIEQPEYLEFLELLFYASTEEQASSPESVWLENAKTHALKLLAAFGSVKEAVAYINRYEKVVKNSEGDTKQLIHDACLFSLPEILATSEISNSWNMSVWQKIVITAKPNGPDDEIMRLLPFAKKITDYIQNPLNKNAMEQMVREEVENDFRNKYKIEFKNIQKISFEQWLETELKHNPKLVLNSKLKLELQAVFRDETLYIQYRLEKERFLPSTIKSKLNTIIPFSAKTSLPYIKKIANTFLYKRANENPEAAHLFFKHRIPEYKFNLYLTLQPDNSHEYIPDITIEGKNIHEKYKKFHLQKLNASDPRAAVLGELTSCCQSLGSQGEACAIHGITDKKGGFFVLRDEKNNIIAQCWAWYGKDGNIVFDSIEIAMNDRKHKTMIMDFYVELANLLVQQHNIPCVLVGTGGVTPGGMKILKPHTYSSPENFSGYRDSKTQALVAARAFPLLIETYKDINTGSLLADKPIKDIKDIKDITLSRLQDHYDLYVMNGTTPSTGIQDKFESYGFTKEMQHQRSELINSWFKFLQEFKPTSVKILPLQKIRDFIELGVNLNTHRGYSILDFASMSHTESVDTIKFLIENGAIPNCDTLSSVIFNAIHFENNKSIAIIKFLLMHPAIDINEEGIGGKSALYKACQSGSIDIARLLLSQNRINTCKTLLHAACQYQHYDDGGEKPVEVVKFVLMQKNIDINAQDQSGYTALHVAAAGGQSEDVISLLLQHGADIQYKDNKGKTALDIACSKNNKDAIQQLLLHAKTHSLPMESIMSIYTFNTIFPGSETKEQKRETPKKIHRFFSESSSNSSSDGDSYSEDDSSDLSL